MKEEYEAPVLEVTEIEPQDVILTSGCGVPSGQSAGSAEIF